MTVKANGHFYVGELPDGRFVAASASSPYFCFRAESEQAVIRKVKNALSFYREQGGNQPNISVKSHSQTVTTVFPRRRVSIEEALEAA